MINQNIIIYKFIPLYQILKEIEKDINLNVISIVEEKDLNNEITKYKNYLIITRTKILSLKNQLILNNLPMNLNKIVERLNIEFIKNKYLDQSKIIINRYNIDLNSKVISLKKKKLKLTEKEIRTIVYLSKSIKPVKINELQTEVWGYQSDLETHTVETHIYRLRKFLDCFNDKTFISSEKMVIKLNKKSIKKRLIFKKFKPKIVKPKKGKGSFKE